MCFLKNEFEFSLNRYSPAISAHLVEIELIAQQTREALQVLPEIILLPDQVSERICRSAPIRNIELICCGIMEECSRIVPVIQLSSDTHQKVSAIRGQTDALTIALHDMSENFAPKLLLLDTIAQRTKFALDELKRTKESDDRLLSSFSELHFIVQKHLQNSELTADTKLVALGQASEVRSQEINESLKILTKTMEFLESSFKETSESSKVDVEEKLVELSQTVQDLRLKTQSRDLASTHMSETGFKRTEKSLADLAASIHSLSATSQQSIEKASHELEELERNFVETVKSFFKDSHLKLGNLDEKSSQIVKGLETLRKNEHTPLVVLTNFSQLLTKFEALQPTIDETRSVSANIFGKVTHISDRQEELALDFKALKTNEFVPSAVVDYFSNLQRRLELFDPSIEQSTVRVIKELEKLQVSDHVPRPIKDRLNKINEATENISEKIDGRIKSASENHFKILQEVEKIQNLDILAFQAVEKLDFVRDESRELKNIVLDKFASAAALSASSDKTFSQELEKLKSSDHVPKQLKEKLDSLFQLQKSLPDSLSSRLETNFTDAAAKTDRILEELKRARQSAETSEAIKTEIEEISRNLKHLVGDLSPDVEAKISIALTKSDQILIELETIKSSADIFQIIDDKVENLTSLLAKVSPVLDKSDKHREELEKVNAIEREALRKKLDSIDKLVCLFPHEISKTTEQTVRGVLDGVTKRMTTTDASLKEISTATETVLKNLQQIETVDESVKVLSTNFNERQQSLVEGVDRLATTLERDRKNVHQRLTCFYENSNDLFKKLPLHFFDLTSQLHGEQNRLFTDLNAKLLSREDFGTTEKVIGQVIVPTLSNLQLEIQSLSTDVSDNRALVMDSTSRLLDVSEQATSRIINYSNTTNQKIEETIQRVISLENGIAEGQKSIESTMTQSIQILEQKMDLTINQVDQLHKSVEENMNLIKSVVAESKQTFESGLAEQRQEIGAMLQRTLGEFQEQQIMVSDKMMQFLQNSNNQQAALLEKVKSIENVEIAHFKKINDRIDGFESSILDRVIASSKVTSDGFEQLTTYQMNQTAALVEQTAALEQAEIQTKESLAAQLTQVSQNILTVIIEQKAVSATLATANDVKAELTEKTIRQDFEMATLMQQRTEALSTLVAKTYDCLQKLETSTENADAAVLKSIKKHKTATSELKELVILQEQKLAHIETTQSQIGDSVQSIHKKGLRLLITHAAISSSNCLKYR